MRYKRIAIVIAGILSSWSIHVRAQSYGTDLGNLAHPASGGMAGASLAEPQDTVSAIFGNPATLSQYSGMRISIGSAWAEPTVRVVHDGTVTGPLGGGPFRAVSNQPGSLLPNLAVTGDLRGLNLPVHYGVGLTALSGAGVELKDNPATLGTQAFAAYLGINAAASVALTERLSTGAAFTLSAGTFQPGFAAISALATDYAYRGSFGLTYRLLESTTVGAYYQTALGHNFERSFRVPGTQSFLDVGIEQPNNIGLGIANRSLMDGNLLLALDIQYKDWDNADFWRQVFRSQWVFAVGSQYSMGPWRFRLGYSYAENPVDARAGSTVADFPFGVATVQYLQATQAPTVFEHFISGGIGLKDLRPGMDVDAFVGGGFEASESFGPHTAASIASWSAGLGVTWRLGDTPKRTDAAAGTSLANGFTGSDIQMPSEQSY